MVLLNATLFWVVAPCSLVKLPAFQKCLLPPFIALMMEAVSFSEMSVNFYQTTRRNSSEGSHLKGKNESRPFLL
jgi:hypothetical protein